MRCACAALVGVAALVAGLSTAEVARNSAAVGPLAPSASSAYFNSLSGYTDLTSTNWVTATFTVTGTTNDTGTGYDQVSLEILDDGVGKASKTFDIPVGSTRSSTATLTWNGPIGTAAPGVGVYLRDLPSQAILAYQDPFYLTGELPLSVEKSAATTVPSGNTLTCGNPRSTSVPSVVISDTVPSGTSFVSASGGGSHSGGVVTWTVGTLSGSASRKG